MCTTFRLVLLLAVAIPAIGLAQAQTQEQAGREAAERIKALSERLRFREGDAADERRYYAEMRQTTERLREAIDRYVHQAVRVTDASDDVQGQLRRLLSDQRPNVDYSDLPLASAATLRGRSLLVAYTIVRPPHHDSATIRGYRANVDGFDLVATTGEDFDGYGMFKRLLTSPVPGELWLIAWGQEHTFNGTKVRFRVYAFDGENFRTVWSPEDMFNASVLFTATGFAIDHHVRQSPFDIHDEYTLTPLGPVKTSGN